MALKITWKQGPAYPALMKGPSAGIVDGRFLVAGGMSYPWREVEYGFWLGIDEDTEAMPSLVVPGEHIESAIGKWHPLPHLPIGPGWTSGAAVAGGLAVVGGRRRAVGMRAIADAWFLDVRGGETTWERLPDRPTNIRLKTRTSTAWMSANVRAGKFSLNFPANPDGFPESLSATGNCTSSADATNPWVESRMYIPITPIE